MLYRDKSLKSLIFFALFGDLTTLIARRHSANRLLAKNTWNRRTDN